MSVIYKYKLEPIERQEFFCPKISKILACKVQYDTPVIWVEHDQVIDEAMKHSRLFVLTVPTGVKFTISNNMSYLDTVILNNGELVFHIYTHVSAYNGPL